MLHLKNSQVTVCEAVIIWNASVLTFWLTYFYRIFYKFRKNTEDEAVKFQSKKCHVTFKNSQVTVCEAVIIWNASVLTFWLTYFYWIFYKFRKNTNIETCHILDIFMF